VPTAYRTHQSPPETERLFLKSPKKAVLYQPGPGTTGQDQQKAIEGTHTGKELGCGREREQEGGKARD
jgi:hypothetical protein